MKFLGSSDLKLETISGNCSRVMICLSLVILMANFGNNMDNGITSSPQKYHPPHLVVQPPSMGSCTPAR